MRNGFTLKEFLIAVAILCMLAALVIPFLLRAHAHSHITICVSNLSQLHKMQRVYALQFGGVRELMPPATGSRFWIELTLTDPPLMDRNLTRIFACPIKGTGVEWGETDFRGPAENINTLSEGSIIGADKVGNHWRGYGGNVLRASGDVISVAPDDPLWAQAAEKTRP